MANEGVKIPVQVTGADAAQADVAALTRRIEELERRLAEAGNSGPRGPARLNDEFKRGGEILGDFDRKAEKLIKQTLGSFSPELAQAADFLFDINDGLLKINAAMLGIAAAGLGIGAVVTLFQQLAQQAKEAEEAQRKFYERQNEQANKVLEVSRKVSEAGLKLGVSATPEVVKAAVEVGASGLPTDLGAQAGFAEQMRRGAGLPFDREQFLRGANVLGGSVEWGKNSTANLALVQKILDAGNTSQAEQVLQNRRLDEGDLSRREAAGFGGGDRNWRIDRFETLMIELRKKHPGIDDKAEGMIRSLLTFPDATSEEAVRSVLEPAQPFFDGWMTERKQRASSSTEYPGRQRDLFGESVMSGSRLTGDQIIQFAEQVQRQFQYEIESMELQRQSRGAVIFNFSTENNNTKYETLPGAKPSISVETGAASN